VCPTVGLSPRSGSYSVASGRLHAPTHRECGESAHASVADLSRLCSSLVQVPASCALVRMRSRNPPVTTAPWHHSEAGVSLPVAVVSAPNAAQGPGPLAAVLRVGSRALSSARGCWQVPTASSGQRRRRREGRVRGSPSLGNLLRCVGAHEHVCHLGTREFARRALSARE
jgi:hypothetical protein